MHLLGSLSAASALLACGTHLTANTTTNLNDLQMTGASALIGIAAQDDGSSGMHLRLGVGANMAQDTDIDDVSFGGISSIDSLTGASISYDIGFDINIGLGIPLMDKLSVEVMTGLAYNSIDTITGTTTFGAATGTLSDASGDLIQIPIMANLRYDFELGETMSLGLFGGAGFQYSKLTLDSVTTVYPGGGGPGTITVNDFEDGTDFNFRYQLGVDLAWALTSDTTLGVYLSYSGTTGADFEDDISTGSLANIGIGARFSIAF